MLSASPSACRSMTAQCILRCPRLPRAQRIGRCAMSDRIAQVFEAQALITQLTQPLPPGALTLLKDEKPDGLEKFLKWAKFTPDQIKQIAEIAGTIGAFASGIGTAI